MPQSEILFNDDWWGNWLFLFLFLFFSAPFVYYTFEGCRKIIKDQNIFALLLVFIIAFAFVYLFLSFTWPTNLFILVGVILLASAMGVHKKMQDHYYTTVIFAALAMGFLYVPLIKAPATVRKIELQSDNKLTLTGTYGYKIAEFNLLKIDSVALDQVVIQGRTGGPFSVYEVWVFAMGRIFKTRKIDYIEADRLRNKILNRLATRSVYIEGRWHLFQVLENGASTHSFMSGSPICHINDTSGEEDLDIDKNGNVETDCGMLSPLSVPMKGAYRFNEDKSAILISFTDSVQYYKNYFPLKDPINLKWRIEKINSKDLVVSEERGGVLYTFSFYRLEKENINCE